MQAPIPPIFPGPVVQSQLFFMVQLHLDAARTSLCGWGRGIRTSLNCVVLGLHHCIVTGCSVRAGKKSTINLFSRLSVLRLCKSYNIKQGDSGAPLTGWHTGHTRQPTAGRQTGIMTQGKVWACFNSDIQLIFPSLSTVNYGQTNSCVFYISVCGLDYYITVSWDTCFCSIPMVSLLWIVWWQCRLFSCQNRQI